MSLELKTGATTSVTGGSALTFVTQNANGNDVLMIQSGAELSQRRRLTSKVSPAVANPKAPGGMQQARQVVTLGKPIVTADGSVGANSIQLSFSRHPETTISDASDFIEEFISGLITDGTIRVLLEQQLQPA
jgi:hypothetical protein